MRTSKKGAPASVADCPAGEKDVRSPLAAEPPVHGRCHRLPGWAVLLGVIVVLLGVNVALSYLMLTYGAESEAIWSSYYQARDTQIDTVVVGSSYAAHAIDPAALDASLGSSSWSLAMPAQDPRGSYQAVKAAIEDHGVRRVIFGIGVDTMVEDPWPNAAVVSTLAKMQGEPIGRKMEDAVSLATDPGFLANHKSLGVMFPWTMGTIGFSRSGIRANLDKRASGKDPLAAAKGTLPGWSYQGQGYGNAATVLDATSVGTYWNPPVKGMHHLKTNEDDVMRMVELCRQHNVELYVVVVPQPSYFTLGYGGMLCKERAALARRVVGAGGRWLDYSMARPDHYRAQDDEWMDFGHLNFSGAARFSRVLGKDVARVEGDAGRRQGEKDNGLGSSFFRYSQLDSMLRSHEGLSVVTLRTSVLLDGRVRAKATPVAAPDTKVEYRFQLLDGSDAVLSQTAYSASPKADIDLPGYQPYKVRVLARQKGSTKPFERTATVVLKSGESNE